jgi:Na+/melibiose symporter-like transporter
VSFSTVAGEPATFTVVATGPAELKYQWYRGAEKLSGKTGAVLSLTTNKQPAYTIFMIRFLLAAIPIVGLVLAMIALARFPLTPERMADIRAQLEARRGKV